VRLICGLFHLDGTTVDSERLCRVARELDLPHRGAMIRYWHDGPIGFAALDFAVEPASHHQGLMQAGPRTLVCDSRLDKLNDPNVGSDAAVQMSALLGQSGPAGLDQVLGDFAFAQWNSDTEKLICGRDIFGVRPLSYVYQRGRLFAFASFPRALHGSGVIEKKLNVEAIARRVAFSWRSGDCLVAGIQSLPPAHYLEVSRGAGLTCKRYWSFNRAVIGTNNLPAAEAAQKMRQLVEDAVRCRLPGVGNVGAHLSGGLDSSSIAILAARVLKGQGRSLQAYSFLDRVRHDLNVEDEWQFVRQILDQTENINWTAVRLPENLPVHDALVDPDKMSPLDPHDPENTICRHAEEHGVATILCGWGGDEAASFNGRGVFSELWLRGKWRTLLREIDSMRQTRGWSRMRIVRAELATYLIPRIVMRVGRRLRGWPPDQQAAIRELLSLPLQKHLAQQRDFSRHGMTADARENRWRLINSPHVAERLEEWAQTGARHGLAFAFPLLDRRVVEFSLSLPSELFLRDGYRRRLFRDAMADVLPDPVRWRHSKYQPFPSRILDVADSRDKILAFIETFAGDLLVSHQVDLAKLRKLVKAFPSVEQLRDGIRNGENLKAPTDMIASARVVAMLRYLSQHGRTETRDIT